MRLLLVGLVLALGAAGVAVILAEQIDTSYRRADEVRAPPACRPLDDPADRHRGRPPRGAARQRRLAVAATAVALVLVVGTSFVVAHNNQSLVSVLTPDASAAKR